MKLGFTTALALACFGFGIAGSCQSNKCPSNFEFAGRLYGSGAFNSNFNQRVEIQFPPHVRLDAKYQQTQVTAANGQSSSHSLLVPQAIPKGIYIVPFGSDDHQKGWAVADPELKGIEWDEDGRITRYGFGMHLYCTTGSGAADATVGGCNVDVDVCYKPKTSSVTSANKPKAKTGASSR